MEAFYTIQGEGHYQGRAAYFIRLAGCDVGCHWCDVKESWDASQHPMQTVEQMVAEAAGFTGRIAVITGGEPLMHDLTNLTAQLKQEGFRNHIETSGAHPLSGQWDWICLSPKKFKAPLDSVIEACDELKIIVFHPSDIEWAKTFIPKLKKGCKLFLQPEWSRQEEMLPQIISFVKENPEWEISLQIHKFMNIP